MSQGQYQSQNGQYEPEPYSHSYRDVLHDQRPSSQQGLVGKSDSWDGYTQYGNVDRQQIKEPANHHRMQSSGANSLASIRSTLNQDKTSQVNKKKKNFWPAFPKKISFRPKGVDRPRKADSNGNKKAMFSNERTMVHWIKAAMLLGSLSMTLLSFGDNNVTPYVGLALLMICLISLIYSTTVFQVRMEWLGMRRDDVKYYDRFAPTVFTLFILATFAFNAAVVYFGDFQTNTDFLKHKHVS
ncbi:Phosphate metabolism transcription protein [Mortierella sp. AD094]|nr:Phosphate metabolism transcription protein [Mortierella sp. AD094]